jgi:outer membrane protein assembly factor BamB
LYINKRLYVGSVDKKMYILNDKLDTIWSIDTLWRIFSSPVLINKNLVCFGSNDSRLYTYNITTEQINYFQMSERIISKPILFNNKLVIQDFLNNIYSIDL